ncbi:hook-length control protein FliK [Marinospirillum celere]|uniref:Hook-length control protein FliK n=1 Tax=Marinospirillum celere TaxID=1122252 RepID=A0A1I1GZQ5_9GAMM|nr:flagellar hook-length control protein FliK [Marinospirillum celere]SFC17021.1 hook-length control protein FliK [Marinospirillum celere]
MQGLSPNAVSQADSNRNPPPTIRGTISEGRAQLPAGQAAGAQVTSSEASRDGQGYRVQVQLTSGEQLTLRLERPLPEGQQLHLQGRAKGQVEVRLLTQLSPEALTAQRLSQVISQLPSLSAQPQTGSPLPINPSQTLIGQVITSQTLTPVTSQNPASYLTQLNLPGGQRLDVITSQPLQPGQEIQINRPDASTRLELTPLNQEALQLLASLQASSQNTSSRSEPASLQSLLQTASAQLRLALPRQAPLSQSLQQLSQLTAQLPRQTPSPTAPNNPAPLTQQPAASSNNTSPASSLQAHLGHILKLIPQGDRTPTSQQLQTFLPLSGLLMEASMARGAPPSQLQADLKFLLQQASAQLRSQASFQQGNQQVNQQLGRQLDAAQARIQVLQQSSLQATQVSHERGQPAQVVQMDLPYSVRGDWFQAQLEIRRWIEEKDAEANAKEAARKTRSWEVQLSFDLHTWGRVHTRLKLTAGQLKADVFVEAKEAWEPMRQQVGLLEARLRRLGAEVDRVECHLGKPPQPFLHRHPQQIIDTEI